MKARVTHLLSFYCSQPAVCMQQSIWDAEHLKIVKQSTQKQPYSDIFQELKSRADKLLNAVPYSVMDKEKTPASGDKHDYMSQARYYWPDPTQNPTAYHTSAATESQILN